MGYGVLQVISVIWPYWDRQKVADESLRLMNEHYSESQVQIVVVDDGNAKPYKAPASKIEVKVVRLPLKIVPKNPCVPINRGVDAADGEFIVLTNPEILHRRNLLIPMMWELWGDKKKYVQAAVSYKTPKGKEVWHSHSSVSGKIESGVSMPVNACFHFLSMLHRELFTKAGGFDEDYRDGAGYDDPDFVLRLNRAGAKFVMRDDLVAEHVRKGAHANWPPGAFERNDQVFKSKWLS